MKKCPPPFCVTTCCLFVLFAVLGCGQGTGTGNPAHLGSGLNTVSGAILQATCKKLEVCHAVNREDCLEAVNVHTGFGPGFGLKMTPAPSGAEIQNLEASGQIKPSINEALNCFNNLEALSCSSAEVQSAYDANAADPYAGTPGLLPAECTGIFGP